jgi:hypothetical protein
MADEDVDAVTPQTADDDVASVKRIKAIPMWSKCFIEGWCGQ